MVSSTTCDVRYVNNVLEKVGFESKDPLYDDGRVILEEGNLDLKVQSRCSTRKHRGLYVLEELQHEGHRLDAAGALYVPLLDYKRPNFTCIN